MRVTKICYITAALVIAGISASAQVLQREYGQATTVVFPLVTAGGTNFQTTWTPAAGETQISKDEAAFANATNTPAHEGNGMWSLALTATEMQAARLMVTLSDGATDIEDQALLIETYGNASGQHGFNLATATQDVNVIQVSGDATSADNLELDYDGTGYNKSNSTLGTVTSNTDMRGTDSALLASSAPTNWSDLAVVATTGQVGVNFSNINGTLDAAEIGTDAITAAKIAADAIGASELATDAGDEIADEVWDEVVTAAQHNVSTSAAKFLREASASVAGTTGTAQAGAAGTITLAAGESSVDDYYNGERVSLIDGLGQGQARLIEDYNGTTKVATVDHNWLTNPDGTSIYAITGADVDIRMVEGDSTATDNFLADYDGTGYNKSTSTVGTVTTNTDMRGTDNASTHAASAVTTDMDANSTQLAAIVADTNELQGDWADGGRLDNILDSTLTEASEKQRPEKNAALTYLFTMVDSTNGDYSTGLTVTVEISQDGGAFSAATNSVSEISDGLYSIELTASEMNADEVVVKCEASGAETLIVIMYTQDG